MDGLPGCRNRGRDDLGYANAFQEVCPLGFEMPYALTQRVELAEQILGWRSQLERLLLGILLA